MSLRPEILLVSWPVMPPCSREFNLSLQEHNQSTPCLRPLLPWHVHRLHSQCLASLRSTSPHFHGPHSLMIALRPSQHGIAKFSLSKDSCNSRLPLLLMRKIDAVMYRYRQASLPELFEQSEFIHMRWNRSNPVSYVSRSSSIPLQIGSRSIPNHHIR